MRLITFSRTVLLALVVAASACGKKGRVDVLETEAASDDATVGAAVTERHDAATVSWVVTPDGKVQARFKSPDDKPIGRGITGTLKARPLRKDAKPTVVKLEADPSPGLYTAEIPKLDPELTELSYDIDVSGKPVKGALHLPRGGTRQLVTSAKASLEAKKTAGKKGPNGGIIQVVGGDLLEVVADKKSGEVRVYVLDDNDKPVPVGKRKVKLGVVSSSPETIELDAEPKGLFFTGKLSVKVNPVKLTVVLYEENEPEPEVVLCGWDPVTVVVCGADAPSLELFVVVNWAPVVVVHQSPGVVVVPAPVYHHKGKGKWKHRGGRHRRH